MPTFRLSTALRWLPLIALALVTSPAHAGPAPLVLEDLPQSLSARQPRSEAETDRIEALALFAAARTAEQGRDNARALRCYQRALRCDPTAQQIVGAIYALAGEMNQHDVAVRYLLKAAELGEVELTMVHRLGMYLAQTGDFARTAALYEKALAGRDPKTEKVSEILLRMELGRMYHLLEQYKKGADQFARVVDALDRPDQFKMDAKVKEALLGEEANSWQLFGECFLLADRHEEAAKAFRRANDASPNEPLLQLNVARVAARSGKPEQALAGLQPYFDKRLATEGTMPYETLAGVLKALGREKELIERLEKLYSADPNNIPLGYVLAGRYEKAGQADKAEPLYVALLKKAPDITAYRSLLQTYRKGKQPEKLLGVLGSVVEKTGLLEAVSDEAQAIVGDADLMRQLAETARRKLKDSPEKSPYPERQALALLAMEAKQYDMAAEFCESALAADAKRANEVLLSWGVGLLLDDRAAEAIKVFQRGVDLVANEKRSLTGQLLSHIPGLTSSDKVGATSEAVFHFYLAGALAMADRTDEALAAARKAAELNKKSVRFASRGPWILYHAKQYDKAIRAYGELIEKFDADHQSAENREALREARLALSNLCVLTKRLPEAEEWLQQVLDEFPDDVGASNDLGYLWADQNKHLERSLKMVQRAVAAEPENMAYLDSLGWVYYRLGRYTEAVAELEKAIALGKPGGKPEKPAAKPGPAESAEKPSAKAGKRSARENEEPDGTIFDHLGDAYLKAGQPEKAKDAWRKAAQRFRNGKEKDEEKAKEAERKLKS